MNSIIIKGRLTADPELKFTQTNNTAYCGFSVAVNRRFVQEGQQDTDFFNVTAWSKTAEFISKYFTKGQEILIQGRLQQRSWETESGEKRYAVDIVAEQVEFCGSKKDNSSEGEPENVNQAELEVKTVDGNGDDLPF